MKLICAMMTLLFMQIVYADVTCYLNLVKNSCWNQFDVTINVLDMNEQKHLADSTIGKDVKWKRISFRCKPAQTLYYKATFSPPIWQSEKGKVYSATQYWSLPGKLKQGDAAWELTICFPKDFSGVPFPVTATGNCACQYDQVTPLKLKKVTKVKPAS